MAGRRLACEECGSKHKVRRVVTREPKPIKLFGESFLRLRREHTLCENKFLCSSCWKKMKSRKLLRRQRRLAEKEAV